MSSISYDFRDRLVDDIDPSARDEALINHIAGDDELRQDFTAHMVAQLHCHTCGEYLCGHDDAAWKVPAGIAPAWDAGK